MEYYDLRSINAGSARHILQYDTYEQAANAMRNIKMLADRNDSDTLLVTILKNGNVFLGHGVADINKRFIANALIDVLPNINAVADKSTEIYELMRDTEFNNAELIHRNAEWVESLGFNLFDIGVKFVGFTIVAHKRSFFTDAIGLIELTGEHRDSFYNAVELMK